MQFSGEFPINDTLLAYSGEQLREGVPCEDVIKDCLTRAQKAYEEIPVDPQERPIWDWNRIRQQIEAMVYGYIAKYHEDQPRIVETLPDSMLKKWRAIEQSGGIPCFQKRRYWGVEDEGPADPLPVMEAIPEEPQSNGERKLRFRLIEGSFVTGFVSDIKRALTQKDDYIDTPKESGYRGIHLIYRYFSDKKTDYNTLKVEVQLRSQLQHAWATAVESVGAFIQQALKSSLGEQDWLRFFALMGTAIAIRENSTPVPDTPTTYGELVKELREYANALDVASRLATFGAAMQITESPRRDSDHYFLLEVNHKTKLVTVTGFKQAESDKATAKYLEVEKS